uniref:Uncharacterized protein n=1 Tax=Lotus japonicus TaxID=34305 RepID=I3SHK3_LOTJA|nr:unknown [Lotus japonicus]
MATGKIDNSLLLKPFLREVKSCLSMYMILGVQSYHYF